MSLRFTLVEDSESAKKWISQEIDYGDFPLRFIINLQFMEYWSEEYVRDTGNRYVCCLECVSLVAMGEDNVKKIRDSWGMGDDLETWNSLSSESKYIAASEYGCKVPLWTGEGNNSQRLIREARKEGSIISSFTFGFAMDRRYNGIGATGWDIIAGELYPKEMRERIARGASAMKETIAAVQASKEL